MLLLSLRDLERWYTHGRPQNPKEGRGSRFCHHDSACRHMLPARRHPLLQKSALKGGPHNSLRLENDACSPLILFTIRKRLYFTAQEGAYTALSHGSAPATDLLCVSASKELRAASCVRILQRSTLTFLKCLGSSDCLCAPYGHVLPPLSVACAARLIIGMAPEKQSRVSIRYDVSRAAFVSFRFKCRNGDAASRHAPCDSIASLVSQGSLDIYPLHSVNCTV